MLSILWFCLIAVLFTGFFFLEGFDYGVGMLATLLGKNDSERRVYINTIGPHWDGNEVWLLTAGGAMFAAFPHWYATLFSGLYLPLFLIVIALIVRGVSFEFRSKSSNPAWRNGWDWALCIGSFLPSLLWGVAVSNLMTGVPIDANMEYVGGFFNLLTPFTLLGGLVMLNLFLYHGAVFLCLKTGEEVLLERAKKTAGKAGLVLVPLTVLWVVLGLFNTSMLQKPFALCAVVIAAVALVASVVLQRMGKYGFSFIALAATIAAVVATAFGTMFPHVMISTLDPAWSMTIADASSSPYTLKIMTIVAVILVPVVLAYQAWSYHIFRARVTRKQLEY